MIKQAIAVAEIDTPRPPKTAKFSLLDRIGGPRAVHLIVDRLIDSLTSDPYVASRLEGIDVHRLRRAQRRFFVEAFSGASGPPAPALARVDGEALVRIVIHLHDVLDSFGLPAPLAEQLLLAVAARVLAAGESSSPR